MSITVSIQPAQGHEVGAYDVHKPLPYPYHIEPNGAVGRQDFWKGDPARLCGFQRDADVQHVDLFSFHWLEDAGALERAVGMYPVFMTADGSMYTDRRPVESVTVYDAPEVRP